MVHGPYIQNIKKTDSSCYWSHLTAPVLLCTQQTRRDENGRVSEKYENCKRMFWGGGLGGELHGNVRPTDRLPPAHPTELTDRPNRLDRPTVRPTARPSDRSSERACRPIVRANTRPTNRPSDRRTAPASRSMGPLGSQPSHSTACTRQRKQKRNIFQIQRQPK